MVKTNSLKIFHRMLNFLILVLCVVVFGLMLRLLKTEYFNSIEMNNVIDNTDDSTDLKCDCHLVTLIQL